LGRGKQCGTEPNRVRSTGGRQTESATRDYHWNRLAGTQKGPCCLKATLPPASTPVLSFLRAALQACRIVTCADATQARDGRWLKAAGLVLVRQRPGSAKGVLFITLEDETGIANLVLWPQTFEKVGREIGS
jgi:DNA polymerase III alpha subunit